MTYFYYYLLIPSNLQKFTTRVLQYLLRHWPRFHTQITKKNIFKFKICLEAAKKHSEGRMRPAGRELNTPALECQGFFGSQIMRLRPMNL
jgi:hypothetical protein